MTKQEIAKALNISITTVTTNINALIMDRLVLEAGIDVSTGGRKPILLQLSKNAKYSIGVDITPNTISFIITNLLSEIIYEEHYFYDRFSAFSITLRDLATKLNRILKEKEIQKNNCMGVGISLPGIIDEDQLTLKFAPNIGISNYSFQDFQTRIELPVYLENEANIAAYAELVLGNLAHTENIVYLSITDGIGTGILINNQIYKSIFKKAGEFGHMCIEHHGTPCNCGRQGCWEMYASKRALLRFYQEIAQKEVQTLDQFFTLAAAGDRSALSALDQYLDYLSTGIENIVLALDPELIVIGGELSKHKAFLDTYIPEKLQLESSISASGDTRILISRLQDRGSLQGAGLLPIREMFNHFNQVI
jgi:predicted NBD/HSP70 family sugar kinase